jgi:nondiscriminating glutamyl-tRNA synthetase
MPDEGPHKDGWFGPYIQSERTQIYAPRLHQMCEEWSAYYCFCSSERLDALRKEQEELKLPTGYDGHCRHIPLEEAKERRANGEKCTIRLKVPKGETVIMNDAIRGRIEFQTSQVEDAVLLKSDGIFPTYHWAVVIDDYMMGITHVMRGEEWISSIPIQILTARGLDITLPEYAHLPNIMGNDGKKLSKRTGDTAVSEYLSKWYLTEALLNFIALLGWHPKQDREIMSMSEMIERFQLKDVHKSWAMFDMVKLDWMNGEYIKHMKIGNLHERLAEYLKTYEENFYKSTFSQKDYTFNTKIISELQTRMKRFDEFVDLTRFLYWEASIRTDLLINPKMKIETLQDAKDSLILWLSVIENIEVFDSIDTLKEKLLEAIGTAWKKNGQVLWPMRVALSGEEFSPGTFELMYILGKDESIRRLQNVINLL